MHRAFLRVHGFVGSGEQFDGALLTVPGPDIGISASP
jgi:hypothetical protein